VNIVGCPAWFFETGSVLLQVSSNVLWFARVVAGDIRARGDLRESVMLRVCVSQILCVTTTVW